MDADVGAGASGIRDGALGRGTKTASFFCCGLGPGFWRGPCHVARRLGARLHLVWTLFHERSIVVIAECFEASRMAMRQVRATLTRATKGCWNAQTVGSGSSARSSAMLLLLPLLLIPASSTSGLATSRLGCIPHVEAGPRTPRSAATGAGYSAERGRRVAWSYGIAIRADRATRAGMATGAAGAHAKVHGAYCGSSVSDAVAEHRLATSAFGSAAPPSICSPTSASSWTLLLAATLPRYFWRCDLMFALVIPVTPMCFRMPTGLLFSMPIAWMAASNLSCSSTVHTQRTLPREPSVASSSTRSSSSSFFDSPASICRIICVAKDWKRKMRLPRMEKGAENRTEFSTPPKAMTWISHSLQRQMFCTSITRQSYGGVFCPELT